MRIGFDVSQTGATKAGCGYFAYSLGQALARLDGIRSIDAYTSFGDEYFDLALQGESPVTGRSVHYPLHHANKSEATAFWNAADLGARLGQPDIIHSNNFWCPDRRQLSGTRIVYTLYDLSFMIHPEWTSEANRLVCLSGMFRAALNADWIVAISESSKRDFLRHFPAYPAERIAIIYPASRFAGASIAPQRPVAIGVLEPGQFWLSVGTIEPRKNQLALARAYARYFQRSTRRLPLVFAGGMGWMMGGFRAELDALGVASSVHFTGYVSDAELAWLYSHCCANLYPSHFEGFGLPVLEGMTYGAPTLSSNTSSLPEVCGNAAIQIAPDDTKLWAQAMLEVESTADLREVLRATASAQAGRFNWDDSAAKLSQLYHRVVMEG